VSTQGSTASPPSSSSPFELRWRLFGIRFAIAPSFWIMSALMGWIFLQFSPLGGNYWLNLGMWIGCTLASVLVHEMGHVLAGLFFGQPGAISLAGLGGQAAGKYEELTPRQRIVVAAAGPGAGFLFLALQVFLDESAWNWLIGDMFGNVNLEVHWSLLRWRGDLWRLDRHFKNAMIFLLVMNLFWNLLNLLPIFPMDGGMILRDVCIIISPTGGEKFAFGASFLFAGLVSLYCLAKIAIQHRWISSDTFGNLPNIMEPHFGLIMFGMLAVQNFFLLWQVTRVQRSDHYRERFDD
jgi:hypothetical protein